MNKQNLGLLLFLVVGFTVVLAFPPSRNNVMANEGPGRPVASTYQPGASAPSASAEASPVNITLSKENTVVFRAVVSPLSVSKTQQELLEKSHKLGAGKPIYLYLDTPGGDISAGNLLIDTARGLGRPVHTVSSFAASMGFNIVQRLGTRYVTPSGQLMAHRAAGRGALAVKFRGELLTAVGVIYAAVTKMEKQNAAVSGLVSRHTRRLLRMSTGLRGQTRWRRMLRTAW